MTAGSISILMYHQVGVFHRIREHRSTYCHVRRFRAQMAFLSALRYRVLGFEEALELLYSGERIPPRSVVLTFDDGYENFREYALPVLRRRGFPAVVYAVAGLLGRPSVWFEREGRPAPPLMGAGALREIAREGITVGSHGLTHRRLRGLPRRELELEVKRSKELLEGVLGREVKDFCYPYGSYDLQALAAVERAGYRSAVTCVRGSARPEDPPLELPRKAVSYGDTLIGLFWKLHMKRKRTAPPLLA